MAKEVYKIEKNSNGSETHTLSVMPLGGILRIHLVHEAGDNGNHQHLVCWNTKKYIGPRYAVRHYEDHPRVHVVEVPWNFTGLVVTFSATGNLEEWLAINMAMEKVKQDPWFLDFSSIH